MHFHQVPTKKYEDFPERWKPADLCIMTRRELGLPAATYTVKQYACLAKECEKVFHHWNEARQHMVKCGYDKKPKLRDSATKAHELKPPMTVLDPTDPFRGNLLTSCKPSEQELVSVVNNYYSKGTDTFEHQKNVHAREIRPRYGNFPFSAFGYGTFKEFARRHGLQMKLPCKNMERGKKRKKISPK